MSDGDDDALVKFAREVLLLCELHRRCAATLEQDAFTAFNLQFILVESLAQVAVIPVSRFQVKGDQQ